MGVVGTANAIVGGWGNLGGGLTHIIMPLLFDRIVQAGHPKFTSWRLAFYMPLAMHLLAGSLIFFFGQDTPAGRTADVHKADGVKTDMSWPSWRAAVLNYRTWLLTVVYAVTFGTGEFDGWESGVGCGRGRGRERLPGKRPRREKTSSERRRGVGARARGGELGWLDRHRRPRRTATARPSWPWPLAASSGSLPLPDGRPGRAPAGLGHTARARARLVFTRRSRDGRAGGYEAWGATP